QQPQEVEPVEMEESEQFADFAEEPKVYEGYLPESFSLVFIDGVRRTECLAYIRDEETGESFEGAFLSLGAGALRIEYGRMNLLREALLLSKIERLLVHKKGALLQEVLGFRPYPVEGEISVEVNRYMKEELEAKLALHVYKRVQDSLVVCDGTLSYRLKNTPFLGFVKGMKRLYMESSYLPLLYSLRPGQRSPIIKTHYQQKQEEKEKVDKYTWYVKLSEHEGIHGLARVEVFRRDFDEVKRLADLSAGVLPLFASQSFQDRRSPQNLLPIGRLEKFLRLHLGPYRIIRRQIESFFYA
ncbi:MAG: DNA double-strand break repair nuclease NurA, partial [Aquificaceae bacterium]